MAKKYEKFEEWMVGKEVTWDGEEGAVTREYEGVENLIWVEWEDQLLGEAWIEIDSLEFLDEAPSQPVEDKPIPWQVGQVVWDVVYGKGVVIRVEDAILFPVKVEFDDGGYEQYTLQGTEGNGVRTLFFSEPTIIADTMPPEKSFIPKLKFDDLVIVINKETAQAGYYGYVEKELEDRVLTRTCRSFEKDCYNFFRLGEEIKWEG